MDRSKRTGRRWNLGGLFLIVLIVVGNVLVGNMAKADVRYSNSNHSFSMVFPEGWKEIETNNVDGANPHAVISIDSGKNDGANISILTIPLQGNVTLEVLFEQNLAALKNSGGQEVLEQGHGQLGNREARWIQLRTRSPAGVSLQQELVLAIYKGNAYLVNFTAPIDLFQPYQADWERVKESWRFENF